eukprot:TRINITY_DN44080_c0_g1_i1.p1 TRINITY_DN44080_c0_g1~~TRINITY_DN44080_c0_g1_i1.p1  ORF type:complete len:237 (+),score=65.41 TRINITY_DN44080_c0_g1_i1:151-861(+)
MANQLAPARSMLCENTAEFVELFNLLPKHADTNLLHVDYFIDFVKALATISCEKNSYTLTARARRQLKGKDALSLEGFGDSVKGALWTRIKEKLAFVTDLLNVFDEDRSGQVDWVEFEKGFTTLLDSPDATIPRIGHKVLSTVWTAVVMDDPRSDVRDKRHVFKENLDLYRLALVLAHPSFPVQRVHDQMVLMRTLFNMYDVDGCGSLSLEELTTILNASGRPPCLLYTSPSPRDS